MPSVIAEITPDGGLGPFPVVRDKYLRGSLRVVADLTERDAITAERRSEGMEVNLANGTKYKLVGGIENANWSDVTPLATLPTGKTLWVDGNTGVNAAALRGRFDKHYLTCEAAKTAALSGDTINVAAGTYNEFNLFKDGVNWHFQTGAIVIYTGSTAGAIFDDSVRGANGAVTCKITGYGQFINRGVSGSGTAGHAAFFISNASSNIYAEGLSAISESATFYNPSGVVCQAGAFVGHFDRIASGHYDGIIAEAGSPIVHITARIIEGCSVALADGINGEGIEVTSAGANVTIVADTIISYGTTIGLLLQAGTIAVRARYIEGGTYGIDFGGNGLITCDLDIQRVHTRYIGGSLGRAVNVTAATPGSRLAIRNARLTQSENGAVVEVGVTNVLALRDCILVAGATATESIIADSAKTIAIYGHCMANKAKHANITLSPLGAFTVDASVI